MSSDLPECYNVNPLTPYLFLNPVQSLLKREEYLEKARLGQEAQGNQGGYLHEHIGRRFHRRSSRGRGALAVLVLSAEQVPEDAEEALQGEGVRGTQRRLPCPLNLVLDAPTA